MRNLTGIPPHSSVLLQKSLLLSTSGLTANPLPLIRTFTSGEALTKGEAVYISGDNTVSLVTVSTADKCIGVANETVANGVEVDIAVYGPITVTADGAVAAGDILTPAFTAGRVIKMLDRTGSFSIANDFGELTHTHTNPTSAAASATVSVAGATHTHTIDNSTSKTSVGTATHTHAITEFVPSNGHTHDHGSPTAVPSAVNDVAADGHSHAVSGTPATETPATGTHTHTQGVTGTPSTRADILITNSMDGDVAYQASPNAGPVWTSPLTGYWPFINTSEDLVLWKTTDGGLTFATIGTIYGVASFVLSHAMWFDKWTPGDTGTILHFAWTSDTTPGTTSDGLWYRSIDTADDTFEAAALRIIQFSSSTTSKSRTVQTIGITKSIGGNLYAAAASAKSVTDQVFFYRSTDAGLNWTARTNFIENNAAGNNDFWLLMPGNETDTNDIWIPYLDHSANEISIKVYDDSGNSFAETAIDSTGTSFGGESMTMMQAMMRHSDRHLILVYCTEQNAATGDLRVQDITSASSITAKADVDTNFDQLGLALTIDQRNDYLYVIRGDASGGTSAVDIHYRRSIDGGTTWDDAVQMSVTARAFRDQSADWSIGPDGGRLLAVFYDAVNDDAYTNVTERAIQNHVHTVPQGRILGKAEEAAASAGTAFVMFITLS